MATLVTIGTDEAMQAINRPKLAAFLLRMCVKQPGEGMAVHAGGEVDIRGAYLALAAASLAGLDVQALAETGSLVSFICKCQTYEVRSSPTVGQTLATHTATGLPRCAACSWQSCPGTPSGFAIMRTLQNSVRARHHACPCRVA